MFDHVARVFVVFCQRTQKLPGSCGLYKACLRKEPTQHSRTQHHSSVHLTSTETVSNSVIEVGLGFFADTMLREGTGAAPSWASKLLERDLRGGEVRLVFSAGNCWQRGCSSCSLEWGFPVEMASYKKQQFSASNRVWQQSSWQPTMQSVC